MAQPSLGAFLDDAGHLAVPAGFSGSLATTGFALLSKPGEPPRFAAKNAVDDAARWDPQFGQAIGCDAVVRVVAALPDGRIAIGGDFVVCGNLLVNRVALWNPSTGTFTALGDGAIVGVDEPFTRVYALAVEGDKIFVGGTFSRAGGITANNVARFDLTTRKWSSLGAGAANGISGSVETLAVASGDLYVGGTFFLAGGVAANRVARFNTVTQTWHSLGVDAANGITGNVFALALAGGSVYVGGNFLEAGGITARGIARFDINTQSWTTLGSNLQNGVNGRVSAIAVVGSAVYVGGSFVEAGGAPANSVARFDTSLQTWSPLGAGSINGVSTCPFSDCFVNAVAFAGGSVYIGGNFASAGGAAASRLARFDTGTQTWAALGSLAANGVNDTVAGLAIVGGDIYVGGAFTQAGGAASFATARFNTSTQAWSALGAGPANAIGCQFAGCRVFAVAVEGSDVYVGGSFTQVGGVAANNVARFNTTTQTWHSLGTGAANGTSGYVSALAIVGNDVYVGGPFGEAGGIAAETVARFNKSTRTWYSLGSGTENGLVCRASPCVNAIAASGTDVYVGGKFVQAGGIAANDVARFSTTTGTWSTLGSGPQNGVGSGGCSETCGVFALAIAGSDVYVGGGFGSAGGGTANGIARFNTATQGWSSLGTVAGTVHDIEIVGSNVYVGGDFFAAGGVTANSIARFSMGTQGWSPLGVGAANGVSDPQRFSSPVNAIAVVDGNVYAGGFFALAGGAVATNIARFNTSTESWSSLGTGAANGVGEPVLALASAGSSVFAVGSFTRAGPNTSLRIARYDARRETTASLTASTGTSAVVNTPIAFTATIATTSFPAQPGLVEFLDGEGTIAACADQPVVGGLDTRAASCTTGLLRVGPHVITARYKGDALNFIGTSDPVMLQVQPPTFSYTPATLPGATFNGAGYSSGTIGVSSAAGTGVIAPVAFQVVDGAQLPPGLTATPQPNGLLVTGTPTQAGTFNFTVRATDSSTTMVGGPFSSDRQYTIVVARAPQTIGAITRVDAQPLDNGVAFADGNFAVQASASSALPVEITSDTRTICEVDVLGSIVQPLQIGTCTLRARQAGNANYEPAADLLRSFQIKATPVVSLVSTPNPSLWRLGEPLADPVTLTATVEGSQPGGLVRFQRGANTIVDCPPESLLTVGDVGTEACDTTRLPRGTNMLVVQYLGDSRNLADTSNVITHQINVVTATDIASVAPSPCVVGQACTVTVTMRAGNGVPTGPVQVSASTGGSCTITLTSNGGSCVLTATAAGSGTVSATYLGSPPWLASPAATQQHPFVATLDELFTNGFEPVPGNPP